MSANTLTGLSHVCFGTHDLPRMISFYKKVLGGEVIHEFRNDENFIYGVFIKLATGTFIEFFHDQARKEAGGAFRHFCFRSDNLEALQEQLEKKGFILEIKRSRSDKTLQGWIEDPDGNKIEFHQYDPLSLCFPHT